MKSLKNSEKAERIYSKLKSMKRATANEVISELFKEDLITLGARGMIKQRGWRYYVHLNKLFAQMERAMIIEFTGKLKIGETGKEEKIWSIL
jgi:hypothetical protein